MNYFENQWVEVFHAGEQTDSSGRTKNWTSEDLEKIVNNYNTKKHEAPIVIGHPKENAPAFGWVKSLKTDGKTLFARFKQLVPEFIDAVRQGLYKKRSISLYPDFTLRHIGFLGAAAPAVKGLADIRFSECDNISIEFENMENANMKDVQEKKADDFSEINQLREQLRKEQEKTRKLEFKEFVKELHSNGKIVSDHQNLIIELMEAIDTAGEFNFSEGKAKTLDKFMEFLENQPKIVEFGEAVTGEKAKAYSASERLDIMASERVRTSGMSYSEALSVVQSENPDLAEKAAQEI